MVNQTLAPAASRFGTVNGYFANFAAAAPRVTALDSLIGQKSLHRMPLDNLYFGTKTSRFAAELGF